MLKAHIVKRRRELTVDVSLELESGEALALFGSSGVGKSTVLACIAGIEEPDGGFVTLNGVQLFPPPLPLHKRTLGFLTQEPDLFPHLAVAENVRFGVGKEDEWMDTLRDRLHSGSLWRAPASLISGGQARRVSLARMLARRPPLILLDEPFAGLDRQLTRELIDDLLFWSQRLRFSMIAVDHQAEVLARLCPRRRLHFKMERLCSRAPGTNCTAPRRQFCCGHCLSRFELRISNRTMVWVSPPNVQNSLGQLRQKRGLSAVDLAAQIGVSRQTIYSMEAGTYVPNTIVALKLAQVFGVPVEEIFRIEEDHVAQGYVAFNVEILPGEPEVQPGQPVQLCQVAQRLVAACPQPFAWELPVADAILIESARAGKQKGKVTVQLLGEQKELAKRVMVAGCDPGISVLSRHVQRAGIELVIIHRNSSESLDLLKQGFVHVAGTHLWDEATGESNLPAVRKRFAKGTVAVIGFALWEEGIVLAHGNPKDIRTVADFARKDVTIVNREPGAGCRLLLDSHLNQVGIPAKSVRGYGQIALGHLPAAWHVLTGKADCCIATRAVSRVFGLDFIPLLKERYDLVIRKRDLNSHGIQVLLDTLGRSAFRRELEGLGGYDTRTAGDRVA